VTRTNRRQFLQILSSPVIANALGKYVIAQPGRPFISWQTMSNLAMEALRHAGEHEVNALLIEFNPNPDQPGRSFATLVDDLSFADSLPKVAKRGKLRSDVEKLRANIAAIVAQGKKQNVDVYLVESEVSFPPGMFDAYPDAKTLKPEYVWQFFESRLDEVLTALPDAAGIVLYTDEPNDLIIYELKDIDRQAAVRRLIEIYHRVCRRHQRRLMVCTFLDYEGERYDVLLSALRQVPPADDLLVDNYICPGDWGFMRLINPAIGTTGHIEFLSFDYAGEVYGQAHLPLCQAELIRDRLQVARQRGASALLRDPSQDPRTLVHNWLARRYGEGAANGLTAAFMNGFEIAEKSIQTLGFFPSEYPKSEFPDPVWVEFSLRTESLAIYDKSYKGLEERLVKPNQQLLAEVIEEKDQALAMAASALKAVEQVRPYLKDLDYQQLHKHLLLGWYVARVYRLYMEMYFRLRMWEQGGRGPVPAQLPELNDRLEALASDMEKAVGSPAVFCPKSLRVCLAMTKDFLNGKPFPNYPTFHQYPPWRSDSCAQ